MQQFLYSFSQMILTLSWAWETDDLKIGQWRIVSSSFSKEIYNDDLLGNSIKDFKINSMQNLNAKGDDYRAESVLKVCEAPSENVKINCVGSPIGILICNINKIEKGI